MGLDPLARQDLCQISFCKREFCVNTTLAFGIGDFLFHTNIQCWYLFTITEKFILRYDKVLNKFHKKVFLPNQNLNHQQNMVLFL